MFQQNHFAFSPNPWFIAAFFSGQMVLQISWIRKLFLLKPGAYKPLQVAGGNGRDAIEGDTIIEEQAAIDTALRYVPIYALGNLCIGV